MNSAWKKFDKNNGLKLLTSTEKQEVSPSEPQKIVISKSGNSLELNSKRPSALRTALASTSRPLPTPPVSRSNREHNFKPPPKNVSQQPQSPRKDNNVAIEVSNGSVSTNVETPVVSVIPPPPTLSLIPPPPTVNIPPPPSISNIPPPPSMNSNIPPPPSILKVDVVSSSIASAANTLSTVAALRKSTSPEEPKEQASRNDTAAELLESIRKGIKLSKSSERVIIQKPLPKKEAFDVFSVLKDKFRFANSESCESSSFRHGESMSEDW